MKPDDILNHLSQNSRELCSVILETAYNPSTQKRDTRSVEHTIPRIVDIDTQKHIDGLVRVGYRSTDAHKITSWFAIDIDAAALHKCGVDDVTSTTTLIKQNADALGLKYFEVASRSGVGKHLWFLVSSKVDSSLLLDIMATIVPHKLLIGDTKAIDLFPSYRKAVKATPSAIYAPFYGIAKYPDERQRDYDCMNDVMLINQLATKCVGAYAQATSKKSKASKDRSGNTIQKISANGEVDRVKVDNTFREWHATQTQRGDKTVSGHDHSEQSLTFSTYIQSRKGKTLVYNKPTSNPTFETADKYQQLFQLKYKLSLNAMQSKPHLFSYFAAIDKIFYNRDQDNEMTSIGKRLNTVFGKRDTLIKSRRDQHYTLSCTDYSKRGDYSAYDCYIRVEIVHKKKAIVHILMRDLLDKYDGNFVCFSIPVCNERFVRLIQSDYHVYQLVAIRAFPDQPRNQRFNFQVRIKPVKRGEGDNSHLLHLGQDQSEEPRTLDIPPSGLTPHDCKTHTTVAMATLPLEHNEVSRPLQTLERTPRTSRLQVRDAHITS